MNRYRRQISLAVAGVRFGGPSRWYWFGQPVPILPRASSAPGDQRALRFSLQNHLYSQWYCRGLLEPPRGREPSPWPVGPELEPLTAALARANAGAGCWQSGWLVEAAAGEALLVTRDGLHLHAPRGDCRPPDAQPGTTVQLWLGKDLPQASPGFYMLLGDAELRGPLCRVYWNLTADGGVPLVRAVTTAFNRACLPFQLKLLDNAAHYTRCDAAVLYAGRGQYPAVRELLSALLPQVAEHLREAVPAFSKPLAPGIGLAESPAGQAASFGQDRCAKLALALIEAREAGLRSTADRVQFVADRLEQGGIDPDAPYLDAGSSDRYEPLGLHRSVFAMADSPGALSASETAVRIGRRLGAQAFWHADRCNWVGPFPQGGAVSHGALGPDLYAGTAGVAWFLAELGAITDEAEIRRTALGAMAHALGTAGTESGSDGLYAGTLGVILAGVRTGQLLGTEQPLTEARRLLQHWLRSTGPGQEFDLMSGHAGTILALLTLRRWLGDDGTLLDAAMAAGKRLLPLPDRLPYGLAHGAAGVGVALLELGAACGEPEFGLAAERAFARERRRRPSGFPPAWCRGEAGVALSRLRAFQLTGDHRYRTEARTALVAIRQRIEDSLRNQHTDFSLCHGLTGNAEVLRVCGETEAERDEAALAVARVGISRCAAGKNPWPCGLGYTETPGLLTGLAGIGLFYLRLWRPEIQSVLLYSGS